MSKVIQYYYVRGRYTDGATLLGYFPAGSKEQAIEKAKQEWVKSNAKIGVFFHDGFKIERCAPVDHIPPKPWRR